MKRYVRPALFYVDLRTEESMANDDCTGCCTPEQAILWNTPTSSFYKVHDPDYWVAANYS